MILMIDPPVNVFSSLEDVRAWVDELEQMRTTYASDYEALCCIARAEGYADHLLALIPSIPQIPIPGSRLEEQDSE